MLNDRLYKFYNSKFWWRHMKTIYILCFVYFNVCLWLIYFLRTFSLYSMFRLSSKQLEDRRGRVILHLMTLLFRQELVNFARIHVLTINITFFWALQFQIMQQHMLYAQFNRFYPINNQISTYFLTKIYCQVLSYFSMVPLKMVVLYCF